MTDESNREKEIFEQAFDLESAEERQRFLHSACGDDTTLLARIQVLLAAGEAAEEFLPENPQGHSPGEPLTEKPGDKIGRYKLLQQIGEGGCGVVYMAEQEEPVRRRVALKVIKLGMDTKSVIARFEAERQALALMDHPNIAKVLEAGATETGRPYFVMELVRGVKITEFCDENKLSTEERLKLFILVCQAIQHAHQKGVIHRDIKPSNILVTVNDGVPVPKVIDFGIAKATQGRLTNHTLFTAFEQFIGTPAYMSPEQAVMTSLDIDTRSDIYSLGVLLYELLTGVTPFDQKELLAAGLDAMRRTIREVEPVKPSTRLTQALLAADVSPLKPQGRSDRPVSADSRRLLQEVRGDLDWIVMKCLEKDRARRYETANGVAADIQRHLDNQPVVARPPSRLYEFQKTFQRHKFGFAAAAALIMVLGLGVLASTWQALRATRAEREQTRLRQQSETETAKATAISEFLKQMLSSANPYALKGSEYTVRQLLDDFSAGLANQLQDQPEVEAAVRATIGSAYYRLGVADKAQAQHERALTLRRRIFGDRSEEVAESLVDLTWTFFEQGPFEPGQYAKGEPHVREALEIYRKRGTGGQPVIAALWALQKLLSSQARFAEVDAVTQEALVIAGKSPGVEFPELGSMIQGLAEVKIGQAKYAEAESLALEAIAMQRRLRGAEHPETAWALFDLGLALRGQQKLTEAEAVLREALQIFSKEYSPAHKSVEHTMYRLKDVLKAKGDSAAIETLHREVLAEQRAKLGSEHPDVADALHELGDVLRDSAQWTEAEAAFRDAVAMRRKLFGNEHLDLAHSLHGLAWILNHNGRRDEAVALSREELTMRKKLLGHENLDVASTLSDLTFFLGGQARLAEAEATARESLAIHQKISGNTNPITTQALNILAQLVSRQGRFAEAKTIFLEAAEHANARTLNEIAFTLATAPAPKLRDGPVAVTLAEKAVAGTNRKDPVIMDTLAAAYAEAGQFTNAVRVQQEAIALLRGARQQEDYLTRLVLYESGLPYRNHGQLSAMTQTLLDELKPAEAEPLARECLALRECLIPDDWRTFNSRSMLGDSLLGQKKYAEAEPLLPPGYDGMKQRETTIPAGVRQTRLEQAIQRSVQLYEAWDKPDQAAHWKQKLAESDPDAK